MRHFSDSEEENVRSGHWVVVVGLSGNEHYVVDLAGAQYRQFRAVMPRDEYAAKCTMASQQQRTFGYMNRRFKKVVRHQNDPALLGLDPRAMMVHQEAAKGMMTVLGEWEKEAGKTVVQMLKQKESAFKADKTSLIKAVSEDMQEYLTWWKAQPQRFGRVMKREVVPEWEDEPPLQKPQYGSDVPQDVIDFHEEQMRKGTLMINMRDF